MTTTLNNLRDQCWQMAEDKGFHQGRDDGRDHNLVRLALIHTEVSEATQVVKRHWPQDTRTWDDGLKAERENELSEEIADVLIRIFDFAGCIGLDLDAAVRIKMAKNYKRPRLYGTPFEGQQAGTM